MKIDQKIILGFLLAVLLVGIVGYFGIRTSSEMRKNFDSEAKISSLVLKVSEKGTVTFTATLIKDLEELVELEEKANQLRDEIQALESDLLKDPDIRYSLNFQSFLNTKVNHDKDQEHVFKIHNELLTRQDLFGESHLVEEEAVRQQLRVEEAKIISDMKRREVNMAQLRKVIVDELLTNIAHSSQNSRNALIATIIATLILAAGTGLFISRSISHPIQKLTETARNIAAGDLNKRAQVKSKDEIGQLAGSFNQMADTLVKDIQRRIKAEKKIKELNELRKKFISIVAHQLRTPLGSVRWSLETLLKEELGPLKAAQKNLSNSALESEVMVIQRIGDMLTALDIEEGRITLSKQETDISSLIASVVSESEAKAKLKQLTYTYAPPSETLPILLIDSAKISDTAKRLIDNAIVYTPEKGQIDISLKKHDNRIRFEVKDTGVGIPQGEQSSIFNRFFRASNASKMMPDASGISLSIAKYYIEQHSGTIGFKSEDKKGSIFWFDLPLVS